MNNMTVKQMEDLIKSNTWEFNEIFHKGSEAYQNKIGLLRNMFRSLDYEPDIICILSNKKTYQVWYKKDNEWNQALS